MEVQEPGGGGWETKKRKFAVGRDPVDFQYYGVLHHKKCREIGGKNNSIGKLTATLGAR